MDEPITRWRGFSHAELYAQLHSGPGPAASAIPAQRWTEVASIFTGIGHDLAKALGDAKAEWQGASANAAFAQLGDVATWANQVGENAAGMKLSVEQQADHLGRARANMPVPGQDPSLRPDPSADAAVRVLAVQTDHEPVERATSEAARKAYEVMQAYQNDTTATTGSLTSFEETVDTEPVYVVQQGGQRDVVGPIAGSAVPSGPMPRTTQAQQLTFPATAELFGVAQDEPEVRARPAAEPLGGGSSTAALPPRRSASVRRTPVRKPVPVDAHPIAPVAPAAAGGGSNDRVASRKFGESPIPSQGAHDGAEPQPKRRRDRHEEEKITERVEGADAEVPPPVIGSGPYRP